MEPDLVSLPIELGVWVFCHQWSLLSSRLITFGAKFAYFGRDVFPSHPPSPLIHHSRTDTGPELLIHFTPRAPGTQKWPILHKTDGAQMVVVVVPLGGGGGPKQTKPFSDDWIQRPLLAPIKIHP